MLLIHLQKIKILSIILFLIFGVLYASSVYGLSSADQCPDPPAGKKYAFFYFTNDNGGYNPGDEAQCILIDKEKNDYLTFDELKNVNFLKNEWSDNDGQKQINCGISWSNGNSTTADPDLSSLHFLLKVQEENSFCASGTAQLRYEIQDAEGATNSSWTGDPDIYFKFGGFKNSSADTDAESSATSSSPIADCVAKHGNKETECKANNACVFANNTCLDKNDTKACPYFHKDKTICNSLPNCSYSDDKKQCLDKQAKGVDTYISDRYGRPTGYSGPLPDCAFTGSCRDVNRLVELLIKSVEFLFGIVAGLAFLMFVYGGFTMVLSFGNADKTKKGQQILVAAVVGLVIVFSAYILIGFLLDALGVRTGFRVL